MAIDELLMQSASSKVQGLQTSGNPVNDELLQMVLASIMDPAIDANEVGSQLLQKIAIDTLGPNETTAGSPEGLRTILGTILQSMFAANAEGSKTSKPRSR